jgi:solute carrier family 25 (mitochondrial carrier), member 14/30
MLRNDHESVRVNVICAAFSGGISSAIANPTDVLKVRMQIQGNQLSLYRNFLEIFMSEGIRGLYRGVNQTSQRAAVIAMVELPVYDWCKYKLIDSIGDHPLNHFISSFIASFLAAVASCPIDVIRSRLMNQRKILRSYGTTTIEHSSAAYYANSFQCFSSIYRNEGVLALWKGFVPAFLRMGPWNIIFFLTYEKLKTI